MNKGNWLNDLMPDRNCPYISKYDGDFRSNKLYTDVMFLADEMKDYY